MTSQIRLIDHPICLEAPERLAPSGWVEHLPFAMWLVSVLRPRTLVELGTFHGTSYCGFCQAIAALGLATQAFAVDTWEGDPHAGSLGPECLADLRAHHNPRYHNFSTLLQMTFDEAARGFTVGAIDLLHIDGYHTYEAVRHDYETWKPRVSDRGVILFHDVTERSRNFGVWRFWDELKIQYPSFTFEHEHGLGVLAFGSEMPVEIRTLTSLSETQASSVRAFFEALGNRIRLQVTLESTRAEHLAMVAILEREMASRITERDAYIDAYQKAVEAYQMVDGLYQQTRRQLEEEQVSKAALQRESDELRHELEATRGQIHAQDASLNQLHGSLTELHSSLSWRLTNRLAAAGKSMAPQGSRRRHLVKQAVQIVRTHRYRRAAGA